ncbi:MAG: hypothetical protein ACOY3E_06350 [Pseudomonadota bacterium]
MLRMLLALSLVSFAALADSVQPFSYLQVGSGRAGFECGWNETTNLDGTALTASWQFQPEWFVAGQQFESNTRHENCSDLDLTVELQSVATGYVIHSSASSDWFAKVGWLHRQYPGEEDFNHETAEYERTLYDRDDTVVSGGARHRFGRFFELNWDAGYITQGVGRAYGVATMRWLATEQFSVGIQYSQYGAFSTAELNARYRF